MTKEKCICNIMYLGIANMINVINASAGAITEENQDSVQYLKQFTNLKRNSDWKRLSRMKLVKA